MLKGLKGLWFFDGIKVKFVILFSGINNSSVFIGVLNSRIKMSLLVRKGIKLCIVNKW